jgi:hypothetical protein
VVLRFIADALPIDGFSPHRNSLRSARHQLRGCCLPRGYRQPLALRPSRSQGFLAFICLAAGVSCWLTDAHAGYRMRPHPILSVACLALLAIGSTATGQTASRPARIGMLCATVCPTVVLDELRQLGWIEGSTILIDRKPAASRLERLPQLAKELVQSKPDLIIATSSQPVRAAKDATTEIPIVMLYVADPVGVGLVQSLARPGGT